jgi:hypothetical protein
MIDERVEETFYGTITCVCVGCRRMGEMLIVACCFAAGRDPPTHTNVPNRLIKSSLFTLHYDQT